MKKEVNGSGIGIALTIGLILYGVFRLMIATNAIWLAQSPGFIIEIYDEVSDTYGSSLITNDVLNSENIMIKVKNEVTNEPVKGVSVSINWNHKGGPANTIMDMNTTNSEGIVMFSKTDSWGGRG